MLCYQASTHFLVVGDEQEGLGLRGTLGLHLLEAEVIVHHLPDLLNLRNKQLQYSEEIIRWCLFAQGQSCHYMTGEYVYRQFNSFTFCQFIGVCNLIDITSVLFVCYKGPDCILHYSAFNLIANSVVLCYFKVK